MYTVVHSIHEDTKNRPARKALGTPPEELDDVAEKREVWASLQAPMT